MIVCLSASLEKIYSMYECLYYKLAFKGMELNLICLHFWPVSQDAQEFLRCLMDILHEELKEQLVEAEDDAHPGILEEMMEEDKNQSDNDFQSCESGSSSDHTESESRKLSEELSESAMLIQEDQKDQDNQKSWQREKRFSNHISQNNCLQDLEKNLESLSEDSDYSSQGTVKVQIQSRISGNKLCCAFYRFVTSGLQFNIPKYIAVVACCRLRHRGQH